MNSPQYVIKLPGDPRLNDDFEYVENEDGYVAVFSSEDAAVQHLIDKNYGDEKMESAEFIRSIGICKKCGAPLFPSDLPDYESQCFDCDEDFYSIEQEVEKK